MSPSTPLRVEDCQYQDVHKIVWADETVLWLIGTAHISASSVDTVEELLRLETPDVVLVELDERRLQALEDENRFKNLDIIQIIKGKQTFFVIASLILGAIQKKMSTGTGVTPGAELKQAVLSAREVGAKVALVDRDIGITLRRAWRLMPFWGRMKLFAGLLVGEEAEINEEILDEMKQKDAVTVMMEDLAREAPTIKHVLIDERDIYMSAQITENRGRNSVAVVGAGHVPGILRQLEQPASAEEVAETTVVPPPSLAMRMLPWGLTAVILSAWGIGFMRGNYDQVIDAALWWILANGVLCAIGGILALAHPLTVVAAFVAAPITSLNPTIGAGMVTALVQAMIVRPRVLDLEDVQADLVSVKAVYSNRLLKILLVFVFTSIGSSIGTFVALPYLLRLFA